MERTLSLWGVAILAASCGGETSTPLPPNTGDALATYASIAAANYEDSVTAARTLDQAVNAFIATPSSLSQQVAQSAWLDSREPYLETEVFRFYDGPIDNPANGPEGLINAWPLDEAYIDYVAGNNGAGIINDGTTSIDIDTLVNLNENGGEENIATGFHAIEFLLWGQDQNTAGPGQRPATDYSVVGGTASNQARRAQYLATVSTLLVANLQSVSEEWSNNGAYRATWSTIGDEEGLRRVLTGMIILSGFETGGERLQTALDSGDQEDEHSCFSDNTHRDMIQDIQGVLNVWDGNYLRLDGSPIAGTGIGDVVRAADPALADTLDAQIAVSLAAANALVPPFDNEIAPGNTEGRARVQSLIDALRAQERSLQEVFRLFDLSIPSPE